MSTKLQDLAEELRLNETEVARALSATGITVPEGVKRVGDKDARRLRSYVLDQRRREVKKQEMIRLPSVLAVRELAGKLSLPIGEVIGTLLKNGLPVTVNEQIDYETAAIIASDLGYQTAEDVAATEAGALSPEKLWEILKKEEPERQQARPPVVTIMGHVDHGKTTILDAIRQANVAATEAGGITQRISGYQVRTKGRVITFIDTPGHEAFEFMRKRGASIGDIAILVVAADAGVQEQTLEALRHAQEAEIPILVALTKIDRPEANIERVKRQLGDAGLTLEEWGGAIPVVPVSAKTGEGLDLLLEMILTLNDLHPARAIADRPALASIIEAHRDPHSGPLATVLIHTGTLKLADHLVVGKTTGTVRKLTDFNGREIREALPGSPVTIVGLEDVPAAGEVLQAVEARAAARDKARLTIRSLPQVLAPKAAKLSREEREARRLRPRAEETPAGPLLLPIVLKTESQGSLEALRHLLMPLGNASVSVRLLRADVGAVTDSDVRTAEAATGIVLGFNVPVTTSAQKLADVAKIPIRTYDVVYQLTDEVRARVEKLTPSEILRTDLGTLAVLKIFFGIRGRQIVGGRVQSGRIAKGAKAEVRRQNAAIATGSIAELQENRIPVSEVTVGRECGITFTGEGLKMKTGDTLHIYTEDIRKKTG